MCEEKAEFQTVWKSVRSRGCVLRLGNDAVDSSLLMSLWTPERKGPGKVRLASW